MSMFEQAIRLKLRFESSKGPLSVEDLWDLPMTSQNSRSANLDDVARGLNRQLQSGDNVSFVTAAPTIDPAIQLKFDIVKHVIATRLTEASEAATARANREKKQRLMSLIEQKENESLSATSLEELRAMVAAM